MAPETMDKQALQDACRAESKARGMASSWVASASKQSMIAFLTGDESPATSKPAASQDLAAMIAAAVAPLMQPQSQALDVDAVNALIQERLDALTIPRAIAITVNTQAAVTHKYAHEILPVVVQALAAGCHVWLTGPAGSGKTTIAHQAAASLALDYSCASVCAQTTQSALLGYMDATGKYVRTLFRERFEHGGLFCLDEIDNGNANVLSVLNAALANGVCAFPDGMVNRHETFKLVACANTFGLGADAKYVGRNPIDGATRNRFAYIEVGYDEALELALAGNQAWTKHVQAARKAAADHRIQCIISPRASIMGAALLASGMNQAQVEAMVLYAGLSAESISKIKGSL